MTPDEFGKLMDRFVAGLPEAIASARFVATQTLRTDMMQRTVAKGGAKDINGNTRRYKDAKWVEARKSEGLQVAVVDHVFKENLQSSFEVGTVQKANVLKITGKSERKKVVKVGNSYVAQNAGGMVDNIVKARGLESHFPSKAVFEASDDEEKRVQKAYEQEIGEYIAKFFD